MGLASSQARILLLTAQKSDLEYRAQVINQRKLNLSNQTQALSERYSRAINNRKLTFALFGAENDVRRDLSYSDLRAENGNTGTYLITDKEGKYIVRNQADQESIFLSLVATGDYEKTAEDYNRFVQNCNKTYYSDNNGQKTLLDNNKFFQDSLRNGSLGFIRPGFVKFASARKDNDKSSLPNSFEKPRDRATL